MSVMKFKNFTKKWTRLFGHTVSMFSEPLLYVSYEVFKIFFVENIGRPDLRRDKEAGSGISGIQA